MRSHALVLLVRINHTQKKKSSFVRKCLCAHEQKTTQCGRAWIHVPSTGVVHHDSRPRLVRNFIHVITPGIPSFPIIGPKLHHCLPGATLIHLQRAVFGDGHRRRHAVLVATQVGAPGPRIVVGVPHEAKLIGFQQRGARKNAQGPENPTAGQQRGEFGFGRSGPNSLRK